MPEPRYLTTSAPSSPSPVTQLIPGIGFPSCNTALSRIPPNTRDPHGYYDEIGVRPSATDAEIRSAVRGWYRVLHPDTGEFPDTGKLCRIKAIAEVLLDPLARQRYNRTPPGQRLMDAVYEQELIDSGVLDTMTDAEVRDHLGLQAERPSGAQRFDFFAIAYDPYRDALLAQTWYHYLVQAAPVVSYRERIKVLIHDGQPEFAPMARILAIPRHLNPSLWMAKALFMMVVGFPRAVRA